MIGIALKLCETIVVSEFFELFKTPWEPFRPERTYDVVISDQKELDMFEARLIIVIHRDEGPAFERTETKLLEPILLRSRKVTFPVYAGVRKIKGGSPLVYVYKTGECVGSYLYEESKTILHLGYDFFEEAGYQLTNGQPLDYAGFPTLEIHIANLRRWILTAGVPLVEIPPIAKGSKFFACLTHDVDFAGIRNHKFDRTMAGFVYRALVKSAVHYLKGQYSLKMLARNWMAVAELPLIYVGLLRDFWATFRQYMMIEKGAPSTFFIVPFKNKPGKSAKGNAPSIRAVKYDILKIRKEALHIMAEGCEIGVHGIDSWVDAEKAEEEIAQIRNLTGRSEVGVRMHWLYFGADSAAKLEKAGYLFDSTCGYNEKIGYKAGSSQVYRPPGAVSLLELPMHIMDTALFYPDRMNLTLSEGRTAIKSFIETVACFGGVLTFNWHDRSIAPERLWDGVYRYALNELKRQGAHFLTAGAVVDWFRKRRAVVFEQVDGNISSPKIRLAGVDMSPTDGIVLRIYSLTKCSHQRQLDTSTNTIYRDLLLGDQKEIEVRV
jgi:hypothetical protein